MTMTTEFLFIRWTRNSNGQEYSARIYAAHYAPFLSDLHINECTVTSVTEEA